jgi:sulfur relay (sulfurtransferase) DsrF/TusC family protein
MLYLKRKEISFSGELSKISIEEYVNQQILTIKNSLSTLRLSTDEHEEAIEKIDVDEIEKEAEKPFGKERKIIYIKP